MVVVLRHQTRQQKNHNARFTLRLLNVTPLMFDMEFGVWCTTYVYSVEVTQKLVSFVTNFNNHCVFHKAKQHTFDSITDSSFKSDIYLSKVLSLLFEKQDLQKVQVCPC